MAARLRNEIDAARYPLFILSNCRRHKAENLGLLIARNRLGRTLLVGDTPGDSFSSFAH